MNWASANWKLFRRGPGNGDLVDQKVWRGRIEEPIAAGLLDYEITRKINAG